METGISTNVKITQEMINRMGTYDLIQCLIICLTIIICITVFCYMVYLIKTKDERLQDAAAERSYKERMKKIDIDKDNE
jgi:Tfp pilus assembly protein PilO